MSSAPTVRVRIPDMHCAGCVSSVEKALQELEGIESANVNLADKTAYIDTKIDKKLIEEAIQKAGYTPELLTDELRMEDHSAHLQLEYHQAVRRSIAAACIALPLLVMHWTHNMPDRTSVTGLVSWAVIATVVLAVMIYSGEHYFTGAWKTLKAGRANMDTLVALGTGAAWIYSVLVIINPGLVPSRAEFAYFEAAMFILAFLNLGAALEARARGKTSSAIEKLVRLQPPVALVVRDGQESEIPVEQVRVGDLVRLKPGTQVPVDGEVKEGTSVIDESAITGEFIPVEKVVGSEVVAGTINVSGTLLFRVTRIGQDTLLASIVDYVRKAQSSKTRIARLVDKVAGVFVPVVVLIALINCVLWLSFGPAPQMAYAFETTMSVLIIACPCALGLATPISLIIGIGKAAESGILVRNGEALHVCRNLTTVVFDKTGTLTEGRPQFRSLVNVSELEEDSLLQIAAALEHHSEHPLAHAVLEQVKQRQMDIPAVSGFEAVTGLGVKGTVQDNHALIGNRRFLQNNHIDTSAVDKALEKGGLQGATLLYLAINNRAAGAIVIQDAIRSGVRETINGLQQQGLRVVLMTGDNQNAALEIARQAGIREQDVFAGLLPQGKAERISELREQGETVAMVGDGINDAPSLVNADVGFAIGAGTDIAIESADITLLGNSIEGVGRAVTIARATVRNIKQNLLGAFIYNSLSIPVAAGLLYVLYGGPLLNPMVAGAAMAMSSVTVVTNANRLKSILRQKT